MYLKQTCQSKYEEKMTISYLEEEETKPTIQETKKEETKSKEEPKQDPKPETPKEPFLSAIRLQLI